MSGDESPLPWSARSEWVVTNNEGGERRYVATPEDLGDAGGQFRMHDKNVTIPVNRGACTQVLLHKSRSGNYRLLLNGCESDNADDVRDGYHILPSFEMDKLVTEDATGQKVPAPVIVSVLVEDGACAPDRVTLQVRQRTFEAGVQTNQDQEPVIREVELTPTRPADVNSKAVAVPYPMEIVRPMRVTFVSNASHRNQNAKAKKRELKTAYGLLKRLLDQKKIDIKAFKGLKNFDIMKVVGFGALGLLYYKDKVYEWILQLLGLSEVATSEGASTSIIEIGRYLIDFLWVRDKLNEMGRSEADRRRSTEVHISVFDIATVLQRVAGSQAGGLYSKLGENWTMRDLQNAGRFGDVAVMKYIIDHAPQAIDDDFRLLGHGVPVTDDETKRQAEMARLRESMADEVKVDTLQQDFAHTTRVEAVLHIEVVDTQQAGHKTRRTFRLKSHQSFSAGLVVSGYHDIEAKLRTSMDSIRDTATCSAIAELQSRPFRPAKQTGSGPMDYFANWVLGINKEVKSPSVQVIVNACNEILNKVAHEVNKLLKANSPLKSQPGRLCPSVVRYLPHIVRMQTAPYSFATQGTTDEMATVSQEEEGLIVGTSDLLSKVVAVSRGVGGIVSRAVAQFVETDGVAQPRMRTQLVMLGTTMDSSALAAFAVGTERVHAVGVDTRHVYAPRMPLSVVQSMACREEHGQVRERTVVDWLTKPLRDPVASDIAEEFGLPASHDGELILGTLADLATDEMLERAPTGLHVHPTRAQLMSGSLERSVHRLRAAQRLASAAFTPGSLPVFLNYSDALFLCYLEGRTLRTLLRESAVWRAWQEVWNDPWKSKPRGWRHDMHAAVGIAAPGGIGALRKHVHATGNLRPSTVPLQCFPFLSSQTLAMHTPEALSLATPTDVASVKKRNLAWVSLGMQVEHAYFAAQRIHVMATALKLSDAQRTWLLRDCVRARPVLQCVGNSGGDESDGPEARQRCLQTFEKPISQLRSPLQPQVLTRPATHTLCDNRVHRSWLRAKLSAMRFDVEGLSTERSSDTAMGQQDGGANPRLRVSKSLLDAFSSLEVGSGPQQYLVPFGDAGVQGHFPLLGRGFETLPVYMELLEDTPLPTFSRKGAGVGHIMPRSAHDTKNNRNPLVIEVSIGDGQRSVVDVVLVSMRRQGEEGEEGDDVGSDANLKRDASLKDICNTHSPVAGMEVDAASALLFNVERLVQCAFLVAALHPSCKLLLASPPPRVPPKLIDVADEPKEPASLRLAFMRASALLLFLKVGAQAGTEEIKSMSSEATTPSQNAASGEELLKLDPLTLLREMEDTQRLYNWLHERQQTILEEFEINSGATDNVVIQQFQKKLGPSAITPLWSMYLHFRKVHLQANLRHAQHKTEHQIRWRSANEENQRRTREATRMRQSELDMWPSVVAVANAVAHSVLSDPPKLQAYPSRTLAPGAERDSAPGSATATVSGGETHTAKLKAFPRDDTSGNTKLLAVPLCELAAVLARVL